jgi:chromosome segregation ATPase
MAQDMSFAQALNDARQILIQQALRLKADQDKIKGLQQSILDTVNRLNETEQQLKEQTALSQLQTDEISQLKTRLEDVCVAREQAEAVVNRQGERIRSLENTVADLEGKLTQQADSISHLTQERDDLVTKLPTKDDEEALAALVTLLEKAGPKPTPMPLRMSDSIQAEAA